MSPEDLTDAVRDAAASSLGENGWFLESIAGIVNFVDEKGNRRWEVLIPPDQHSDISLGMADLLLAYLQEMRRVHLRRVLHAEGAI